jgi:D-3-phosphoglycerate dehydrogenase
MSSAIPDRVVAYTDYVFPDLEGERTLLAQAGARLVGNQARDEAEVIATCAEAEALIVQLAPVTAAVIAALPRCRMMVRLGIGYDNIDAAAAEAHGIAVCNVPDYCTGEVADHTLALALALVRELGPIDARVRAGEWKLAPVRRLPALDRLAFGTVGFGRIARAVLQRARAFGCRLLASDPFVPDEVFAAEGVERLPLDDLCAEADLLSLHAPSTPATHHLLDAGRLARLKPGAFVLNCARGALIDTHALAAALNAGRLGGAGLDVFETEPLPADHPLRSAPNAILTSHVAWLSDASGQRLQRLATEEVGRYLRGERLRCPVNDTARRFAR